MLSTKVLCTRTIFLGLAGMPLLVPAAGAADTPRPQLPYIEVISRPEVAGVSAVATINAEELESAHRQNLAEALDLLPGVTINKIGARNEELIQIRGFDSRQVPLFVDGIPIYVPYDGNIDLSRLNIGDVESIRVTKGGGSVLYGPNALGGTINVVTARPREGLTVSTRGGLTFDERGDLQQEDIGMRIGAANAHWYVQGASFLTSSDYFRIPDGTFGAAEDGGRRNNSGSRDLNTSLKLGWTGDNGAQWQLAYARLDGQKQTPPYAGTLASVKPRFWRWPYYDKEDIYMIGALPVSDGLWVRARAYYDTFTNSLVSYDDATYSTITRPYAFRSNYDDFTYGGSLEAEFSPARDRSTTRAIVHVKQDVHREVDNPGQPTERMEDQTVSLALEHERTLIEGLTGTAGIGWNALNSQRADNNVSGVISPFPLHDDSALNGQVGLAWAAMPDWTLGLNLARKTRFPTLKDRYSYRLGTAIPNPDLQAENADHVELSAKGRALGAQFDVAVFSSWLTDAIATVSLPASACTSPPCSQQQNIGRQLNQGLEVSAARAFPYVGELQLGYSYLHRDNRSQPTVLPLYSPNHKGRLASRTELGSRVTMNLELQVESGRFSSSNGVQRTGGFGLFNAGFVVRLWDGLRVRIEGNNLTDKLYAYDEGFPEPGRTYSMTLLWEPATWH